MLSKFKNYLAQLKWGLLFTVALPTILIAAYYGFWASDIYTSEARFVVRSPDRPAAPSLGNLLQGAGFGKTQDDSSTVREYILSRDALRVLEDKMGIMAAYSNPSVDVFSRFAGLDADSSMEALHRYYQHKVDVQTDSASSIVTLAVKAFTAQDAANANRILLEQSENLVNHLNERGRQDLIRYAATEVAVAEKKAKAAGLAVSEYRSAQNVVDPDRQATMQIERVAKLQDELIVNTTQLAQLTAFTPANPQIPSLKNHSKVLQGEIAKENSRVTGSQASLATKAAEYQRLALDADFANKQLGSALASLESARSEALRQQVYLERIAQPNLPDVAQEPRRVRSIAATLILGLVAWGILSMLLAGMREHQG
jgi:capsular polysaccharide transport system permease protein